MLRLIGMVLALGVAVYASTFFVKAVDTYAQVQQRMADARQGA